LTINKPDEFNGYPELKRKLYSALSESDEGELSIAIPSQVSIAAPTPPPNPSGMATPAAANPQTAPEYLPLIVRIEYSLKNPVDGIQFVLPSDAYPFVSLLLITMLLSLTPLPACPSHVHVADFTGRCTMLGPVHR
jgi:transcription initiation factor TFIID subunit 2